MSAVHSGHTRGVRLTTWNLKDCPSIQSGRGQLIEEMLAAFNADITLLTEVNAEWAADGQDVSMSPHRRGYEGRLRLAGVHSRLPLEQLDMPAGHPVEEEALCLVRAKTSESETESILIACSVLPWRGAAKWWSGLRDVSKEDGVARQFSAVLEHHLGRIKAARLPKEPVVWGGDFNQELSGPFSAGTIKGRLELLRAFDELLLEPLTMTSRHLVPELRSVDHLAVSRGWMTWGEPAVDGDPGSDFPSDHARYEVEGL
jgi:endonuclease/exonuclease/phosphatase family metal-dependent hydrolase